MLKVSNGGIKVNAIKNENVLPKDNSFSDSKFEPLHQILMSLVNERRYQMKSYKNGAFDKRCKAQSCSIVIQTKGFQIPVCFSSNSQEYFNDSFNSS